MTITLKKALAVAALFKVIVIDLPLNDLASSDIQTIEIKYDDLMTI